MKTGVLAAGLLVLGLAACRPAADSPEDFALEVMEENFRTTDLSARVQVTAAGIGQSEVDGEPMKIITYSASVLETYFGQHQPELQFRRYVEMEESHVADAGGSFIVSLCRDVDQTLYIPDVGFEMDDTDRLVERARSLASQPREDPAGSKTRASACR